MHFPQLHYGQNIIVQEDRIAEEKVPHKIDGYTWFHVPRTQPRTDSGIVRGGGVSILIRSANENLIAQLLPTSQLPNDTVTETIRVRIFWWNPGGLTTLEINNVYRPPISSNADDIRIDSFDASNLSFTLQEPNSLCCEVSNYNSGILICGDFNAHHSLWDTEHSTDKVGHSLVKFFNNNDFNIANDGSPTFCTQNSKTAVDLTTYRGQIAVENWTADSPPLGQDHHKVLSLKLFHCQLNL